ncbi:hypothetical protein MKX07_005537 [Trichoderma sp. CBMAI-0711]|uniref:Unknwon zinc finger protein n=1 Tax=Trichoderma parareesei TaxID=858221 RepID=A0A2H2ZMV4_TRIPA|nr:hypothetical protein MKX07_005537 [Trichoderma sp. CBMAI-0711]OTA02045.1 unknwon zinc finger protein [Trichoderma parareesei]
MKRSREPEEHLEIDPQADDSHPPAPADADLEPVSKIAGLDSPVEDDDDDGEITMRCSLPPHKEPLGFRYYGDYEAHYHKFHSNRCIECRKNFPTNHLLEIHIEECHDPLAKVAREKGEHTYSCFVEGCERKCMTPQKRRLHLIDKHMYPKNFFFAVTKEGIDGKRSLLIENGHRRRSSAGSQAQAKELRRRANMLEKEASDSDKKSQAPLPPSTTQADENKAKPEKSVDTDMADLTGAMSALQFVPPSIRFGRGRPGFSKR